MIHLGDITKIDGKRIEPVDVIVGGSPCQDLSVAGKRAGLAGERSGLFMDQIRIIKEMRDADHQRGRPDELCRPRYMVWENVPGAFSSQKGADFAAVIEEVVRVVEPQAPDVPVPEKGWPTAGCIYDDMGRWSVAWRVHDAQFWGVPQRRRRIALVADFGGLSAPEVLFERKGLRWDPAQSGTPRQGAAADAEGSSGGASRTYNIGSYHSNAWKSDNPHSGVYETEVSKTLDALNCGYPACNQGGTAVVCMATQQGGAEVRADDRAGESAGAGGDGRLDAVSGGFCQESAKARSIGWGEELAPTLTAGAVPGVVSAVTLEPGIDAREGGQQVNVRTDDKIPTLRAEAHGNVPAVVCKTYDARGNGDGDTVSTITGDHENRVTDYTALCMDVWFFQTYEERAGTLLARQYKDPPITNQNVVRRLTPLECERLQGYQDGWTDIGEWVDSKGKRHDSSDSARYKAFGNSIALPFWFWLLRRISAQYERPATLGSLFDGISGFCLSWARCNGAKNCRWSSEIEEFPMAVTRKHFGDEKTGEVGDIEKYL